MSSCSVYNFVVSELTDDLDIFKDFIEILVSKRDEDS